MKKKFKPKKEPSLLRKVIQVYWERAQERKAERTLARQVWSLDYLAKALDKAAAMGKSGLSLTIEDRDGRRLTIESKDFSAPEAGILDRIDDDAAVQEFVRMHSVR